MKRKGLLLVLLGIVSLFATAKRKVVVFPDFGLAPTAAHTIDSIALSDKETVLYCTLRMYGKGTREWRSQSLPLYIRAQGKVYELVEYDGFVPGKHYHHDDAPDGLHYSLTFPPIPKNTKTIDFFGESGDNKSWPIFDLRLDGKSNPHVDLVPEVVRKEAETVADDHQPLETPVWTADSATVNIRHYGYRKELGSDVTVSLVDLITGKLHSVKKTLSDDGCATFQVPVRTSKAVVSVYSFYYRGSMIVSAGEESTFHIDMNKRGHIRSNVPAHRWEDGRYTWCTGANAELNNILLPQKSAKVLAETLLTTKQQEYFALMDEADEAAAFFTETARTARQTPFRRMAELPISDSRLLYFNRPLRRIAQYGTVIATNGSSMLDALERIKSGTFLDKFRNATGHGSGPVVDLMMLYVYQELIKQGHMLTEADLSPLKERANRILYDYLLDYRRQLEKLKESYRTNAANRHCNVPDAEKESRVDAVLRQHEGKNVVFCFIPANITSIKMFSKMNDFIAKMKSCGTEFCLFPIGDMDKQRWQSQTSCIGANCYWLSFSSALSFLEELTGNDDYPPLEFLFVSKEGKRAGRWLETSGKHYVMDRDFTDMLKTYVQNCIGKQ